VATAVVKGDDVREVVVLKVGAVEIEEVVVAAEDDGDRFNLNPLTNSDLIEPIAKFPTLRTTEGNVCVVEGNRAQVGGSMAEDVRERQFYDATVVQKRAGGGQLSHEKDPPSIGFFEIFR
jgi:hypothetical protein